LHRDLTESAKAEIAKMQREAGTDFPLTVSRTGVTSALAEAAADCGADLVVIGRGKAQKRLGRFRTHTNDIIRQAPCPVLSYCLAASCNADFARDNEDAEFMAGSRKP
jgi:nucleotide-binding universal stress UspA family protein